MTDDDKPTATPEDYWLVFEHSNIGDRVLQDLVARFSRSTGGSGIDRVLNQAEDAGRRKVLDYIVSQINRHNGVNDYET